MLFNFVLVMDRAGSTELPARLLEVAHQQDSHDVNLGTVESEGSNAGERQSQFEAASDLFLSKLSSADVSIQELESRRGYARRVISLEPTNGQAGILIAPELLNKWLPYSPRIAIDA